jgi:hypothetical protein
MHNICDSCETVKHCSQHGCIPLQPLKPCRSPYCECTPGTCSHPGCRDARGEPFEHPANKPTLRVRGWVWKNERCDGLYVPSYTPAQHVQRGELWALVDPQDLHQPLENTDWFTK